MADARGEYWYFEQDVDGNKITVPELRSILLKHGVTYPASAKKPVLVGLFNDEVLPQAAKVQRAHARTKRSTRGIEDVPSSQASTTTDDGEDETLVAPPPAARRTSRRTLRASTEEEIEQRAPTRRAKTPSNTVPTKHAREVEAETDGQPAMRRSRKSVAPVVKDSSPDPDAWRSGDAASPFTQENPFQSGSSPPAAESKERRRRTMGFDQKEKRKSDANRRKTFQPNAEQLDQGIVVPTRKTFEAPSASVPWGKDDEWGDDNAGEEFAPAEQMELVRDRARNGEVDILPPRRRKQSSKAVGTAKAFSLTLLTTALAAFGGVWRQEKFGVGFCGIGFDQPTSLAGIDVPEFATALLPQCEPCPPHAICHRDLRVTCDSDFLRKDHPLSLGGLIPLPPTCEADTEKTRRVHGVADRAVHILRQKRAEFECGVQDAEGNIPQSPEVNVADLKQELLGLKRKTMSSEAFEDLFAAAIGEAIMREEVVESVDGATGGRRITSTSLAELPLFCSIHRSVRESLERHLLTIALILLTIASGSYGKYSITANRATEKRAKQLASDVFDRLANQAALARHEPGSTRESGLSMNQLRDDVLRNEFSSSRRMQLWKRVQKKVENNSNIRAAVREGHSGDITRMWEWTGPVQLLDDGRGSGQRDSGRYSLGWGSSPPVPQEVVEAKHWDEGRPIY